MDQAAATLEHRVVHDVRAREIRLGIGPDLQAGITEVVKGVKTAVKPEAASAIAQTFGFPLALMLAVLFFLIIQGRMDERDPKLRRAPLTASETTVLFVNEADV